LTQLVHARARRRFQRGLKRRAATLMTKLRKAKTEAPPNEKPATVKTHLRNMIVVPEMIGSVIGIYNGKLFNTVEIKPEMTGHYLAEFSISYVRCVVGSHLIVIETRQTWSPWYRCYSLVAIHSIEGSSYHNYITDFSKSDGWCLLHVVLKNTVGDIQI
jgi:ribosomal protein uS19